MQILVDISKYALVLLASLTLLSRSQANEEVAFELKRASAVLRNIHMLDMRWTVDTSPDFVCFRERRMKSGAQEYDFLLDALRQTPSGTSVVSLMRNRLAAFKIEDGTVSEAESPPQELAFPDLRAAYHHSRMRIPAPGSSWELKRNVSYFGHACTRITFNYPMLDETRRKRLEERQRAKAKAEGREFDERLFVQIAKALYYITENDHFIVGYETYSSEGEIQERISILSYELNGEMDPRIFESEYVALEQTQALNIEQKP